MPAHRLIFKKKGEPEASNFDMNTDGRIILPFSASASGII